MKAMPNDAFAEAAMQMFDPTGQFEPQVTYIPEGDCLEFVIAADDYFAERIDGLVTVYYSRETGEIVGSLIKGIRGFCQKVAEALPGFVIEIEAGRVKLSHLFQAHLWMQPRKAGDIAVATYRRLIQAAVEADATAELCET